MGVVLRGRVPPENRLFDGWLASEEPFKTANYCRCSHYVLSGIQCHCGYEELVETCDLTLGEPTTQTLLQNHNQGLLN